MRFACYANFGFGATTAFVSQPFMARLSVGKAAQQTIDEQESNICSGRRAKDQ